MVLKKILDDIVHSVKEKNKVKKQRNQKKRIIEEKLEKQFHEKYFSDMSKRICDCNCGCRNEFKPMSLRTWYTNKGTYQAMHGIEISTRILHVCNQCISHPDKSENRMKIWTDKWAFKSDSQQKSLLGTLDIPMKYVRRPLKEIPYKHQIFLIDALEKEIKSERDEERKKLDEERKRLEEEKNSREKQKPIDPMPMTLKECYETLGVSENAKPVDIKDAYHRLSLQWHPDKHNHPERKKIAESEYKKIVIAQQKLKEAGKLETK